MKVLQVVEPGLDGVFRHVEGLIQFLLQHGHQVNLAYSDCRGSDRLLQLVERVEQAGGRTLNLRVSNAPQAADARATRQLWQFISETKPEVGHAHSSKAGALLRALSLLRKLPVFYTPNAYYHMGARPGLKMSVFNFLEQLFGYIGTTINVSEDEAEFARRSLKIAADRQVVVPNAVDVAMFHPGAAEHRRAWRLERGLPPDAIILGTLGRFSYQKDPQTLYEAFGRVAQGNSALYLAHVGKGDLMETCAKVTQRFNLQNRVIQIDYLPNPASFYQVLDGFVLSSRYEGLSFAVLEALAAGLPLILTDVSGNRDFFRLGLSHIWSSSAGNAEALARVIGEWLADRVQNRPSNHRDIAENVFSFDVCYGRIVQLYREAISRPA